MICAAKDFVSAIAMTGTWVTANLVAARRERRLYL